MFEHNYELKHSSALMKMVNLMKWSSQYDEIISIEHLCINIVCRLRDKKASRVKQKFDQLLQKWGNALGARWQLPGLRASVV